MSPLAIYAIGLVIAILVHLIVIFNFIRYRYAGDRTLFFMGAVTLLFFLDIIFTLSILDRRVAPAPDPSTFSPFL